MKRKKQPHEHAADAAIAMSDLNIFGAVVALLEGGTVHSASYAAQERIIRICKREGAKRLREYDAAIYRATGWRHP